MPARAGSILLCAALLLSCRRGSIPSDRPDGGLDGGIIVINTPICDPTDPAYVVAPQRISLLTSTQLINMIKLVNDDVAQVIVDGYFFDVLPDVLTRFPPSRTEKYKSIPDPDTLLSFTTPAQKVGEYVRDNFAAVTRCASPATDACATAYLDGLATKAYRRTLTTGEQQRFRDLYDTLRSQTVNEQQVTLTPEQAAGFAVEALLLSPQLLWRWELGADPSTSPPGVYLTDAELASNLSFFLTDRPPDDELMADANAGSLRARLGAHVDRLLATRTAQDWLTHVMETYFFLNQLPQTQINPDKLAPIANGGALYADLQMESRLFLSDAMWNGKVTDLLTSRTAFLNSTLASQIYGVPVPAGATPGTFVKTTLPAEQRAGMLTNAGFLTTRSSPTGVRLVSRGLLVKALFTCIATPGIDVSVTSTWEAEAAAARMLATQTAQEQVAVRAGNPACASCHAAFDPYGLVLDWYDVVGRYRTVDDLGRPVDGHTTLPGEIGGTQVQTAVELAEVLSRSEAFTNCMARSALQYALIDAEVEIPLPSHNQRGCAAGGIANALRKNSGQSFTDLSRAVATSPAFVLRKVAP